MNQANCNHYTLYVTEATRDRAVSNLVTALSAGCFCPFEIEVLAVDGSPQLIQEENIVCTPTLVREWPGPRKVLSGDLSECEAVRAFLHETTH